MADSPRRQARALRVPRTHAEAVRRDLMARDWLDATLQPARDGQDVILPLAEGAPDASTLLGALPGDRSSDMPLAATHATFAVRARRQRDYRARLEDLPSDVHADLPSSYDVIGHVAIIKLPETLLPYQDEIGAALLAAHTQVETVALDRGVHGTHRVRDLVVIAGRPRLATIHREHGLEIEVDPSTAYFSPRLATERARLAKRIHPGDNVIDLFAGVGAFVALVAKTRAPEHVVAIDINPEATASLRANLVRNKIPPGLVDVREGDARAVAPRDQRFQHVVLNLPHGATEFVDVAAELVAPGGEVHLYAMVERAETIAFEKTLIATMAHHTDTAWHVADRRHVRNYAPTMDGLAFTLRADRPDGAG